jgi:hypothetical protein
MDEERKNATVADGLGVGTEPVTGTGERVGAASERLPYQSPRIVRRQRVVASTLISGSQCVFDPPLPDGSCP